MKTPEEIFDEAIQAKGLDTASVRDADLYEAGLDAIKQALRTHDAERRIEQLKSFLTWLEKEGGSAFIDKDALIDG